MKKWNSKTYDIRFLTKPRLSFILGKQRKEIPESVARYHASRGRAMPFENDG